jgi:hypothetical protein
MSKGSIMHGKRDHCTGLENDVRESTAPASRTHSIRFARSEAVLLPTLEATARLATCSLPTTAGIGKVDCRTLNFLIKRHRTPLDAPIGSRGLFAEEGRQLFV